MPLSSVLNKASYHILGLYGYHHTTEEHYLAYIVIDSCEVSPTAGLDRLLLRFEVLITVKIHIVVLLHPKDGNSLCLQNISTHLPHYIVS
jgi:hypothetical protein